MVYAFPFIPVIQSIIIVYFATFLSKYTSHQIDFGLISVFSGMLNDQMGNYLKYIACYIYVPIMYYYHENQSRLTAALEYLNLCILFLPFVVCFSFGSLHLIMNIAAMIIAPYVHAKGFSHVMLWVLHLPIPMNYKNTVFSVIRTISLEIDKIEFQMMYTKAFNLPIDTAIKQRIESLENKRQSLLFHLQHLNPFKENSLFVLCCVCLITSFLLTLITLCCNIMQFKLALVPLWLSLTFESFFRILGSCCILKDVFHLVPLYHLKYKKRLRKKANKRTELKENGAFLFNASSIVFTSLSVPISDYRVLVAYQVYYLIVFIAAIVFNK